MAKRRKSSVEGTKTNAKKTRKQHQRPKRFIQERSVKRKKKNSLNDLATNALASAVHNVRFFSAFILSSFDSSSLRQ
jgi:hypothetical protein